MQKTIWQAQQHKFNKLSGDLECDVVIIGGGIAGLWCAYHLINEGKKVCILEAKRVGSGVTAGSSAILTYAQDVIYKPLIKKHGEVAAKKYYTDTKKAIENIRKIVEGNKIECEWEEINYVLFSEKSKGKKALRKEGDACKKLGIKKSKSYQFNPLKLCAWLVGYIAQQGGTIFENTLVREAPDGKCLKVGKHTITAGHFVVATHFPYINLPGFYWLKMYQSQNYCMAIKPPVGHEDFCKGTSYESIDETGFEYRRAGDNILVDGVPVRTGLKSKKDKYGRIEKHLEKMFGDYDEVTRYCAQDCITMDKLPYAGRYSSFSDNIYVVSGFNKWGMTNSYVTAKVVTDMISGKFDGENIYSPQRNIVMLASLGIIFLSFLRRISPWAKKCPHMGCAMKWNTDTKTWDCPCHGSRFDCKGTIINGPATECADCKIKK